MKIPWKKHQCYSYVRISSFYDEGGSCCSCWGLDLCSNNPADFDANRHLQQCPLGRARSAVGWRAQLSPVQRHFPGQWASLSPNFLKYKMAIMSLAFQDHCEVMHVKRLKLHLCIFIPEHRLWSMKASALNPEPDLAHVSSWASDFTPMSQLPHL